jgi:hypothetical protein
VAAGLPRRFYNVSQYVDNKGLLNVYILAQHLERPNQIMVFNT